MVEHEIKYAHMEFIRELLGGKNNRMANVPTQR